MRVLMTTDTVGAVWTYALDLSRALCAEGTSVVLAAQGPALPDAQRAAASGIEGLELVLSDEVHERLDDPWCSSERSFRWLEELADMVEPDVVHLNGCCHGQLELGAPKLVVAHSCAVSWWRAVRGVSPPPRYDAHRELVAAGLAGADLVLTSTRAAAADLELEYGPLSDVRVVHPGLDLGRFVPSRKLPVVMAEGRLQDPARNLQVLDRIADRLPWAVLVAGDRRSSRVNAQAQVDLLGFLSGDARSVAFGRASILCHPARYDPFGHVVLEAAACACALVLSDLPSMRELWDGAAVFVPADDPDALEAALQSLIEDAERRGLLGAQARRRAQQYELQQQVSAMSSLYQELTSLPASVAAS
jgi:glycosyltransferase involved in cell wall biosynthesis